MLMSSMTREEQLLPRRQARHPLTISSLLPMQA